MVPKGHYTLCTVNTAPERAKRLIGRVVEDVKEEYTIDYLQNAESKCSSFPNLNFWVRKRVRNRVTRSY